MNIASFHQLEVGTSIPFISLLFSTYGSFTTHSWLTNLWELSTSINLEVMLNIKQYPPQRTNEKMIMYMVFPAHQKNAVAINKVRKCLNVLSLADLATSRDDKIEPNLFSDKPEKLTRDSLLMWPSYPIPSAND